MHVTSMVFFGFDLVGPSVHNVGIESFLGECMGQFEGTLPPPNIFVIWCDFNARALSNEHDDNCFYSFDRQPFEGLDREEGLRIFIWDDYDDGVILGYVATLEKYPNHVSGWRARPDEQTLYRGEKWW